MIHLYYGEDRLASEKAAKAVLGESYETIDATDFNINDLPTILLGTSLFETDNRKILIKGLGESKELFAEITKYLDTPHEVVILESKIPGTWTALKELKKSDKIDLKENKFPEDKEMRNLAFNVYSMALNNPEKALKMLREREDEIDPYQTVGAWSYKAIETLKQNPNSKQNRNRVKHLAEIDTLIKTTKFSESPWPVLESFILRLKNF